MDLYKIGVSGNPEIIGFIVYEEKRTYEKGYFHSISSFIYYNFCFILDDLIKKPRI